MLRSCSLTRSLPLSLSPFSFSLILFFILCLSSPFTSKFRFICSSTQPIANVCTHTYTHTHIHTNYSTYYNVQCKLNENKMDCFDIVSLALSLPLSFCSDRFSQTVSFVCNVHGFSFVVGCNEYTGHIAYRERHKHIHFVTLYCIFVC